MKLKDTIIVGFIVGLISLAGLYCLVRWILIPLIKSSL